MIKKVDIEMKWYGDSIMSDMHEGIQSASEKSANRIADTARGLVPVGEGDPKHLRDTIRVRRGRKQPEAMFVFAGNRREGVYWHHFVEYGTYDKPAHPFMRPAADNNFNATLAEAERAGRRVINKKRREHRKVKKVS